MYYSPLQTESETLRDEIDALKAKLQTEVEGTLTAFFVLSARLLNAIAKGNADDFLLKLKEVGPWVINRSY